MKNKFLITAFIIAILIRTAVISQGNDFLISENIVFDDAFIFIKIAKNLQAGNGFSFNGIEPTTGAPPLWPFLLSLFPLSGSGAAQIASAISSGLFILSAIFVRRIFVKFFEERFANIFLIIYLFNPFFVLLSLNGMETSLYIFAFSILFWYYFKFKENPTNTKIILFSLAGAMTIFAREEGIFAFLACLIDYFFSEKKKLPIFKCILFLSIFYSPLLIWRFLTFGEITSSNLFLLLNTHWLKQYGALQNMGALILHGSLLNFATGSIILAFLGILMKPELFRALKPIWIFVAINILFYSFIAPVGVFRYQFPSELFFISGIASLFFLIIERTSQISYKKFLAILIFGVYFFYQFLNAFMIWSVLQYTGDGEIFWSNKDYAFREAAEFANENLPKGSVVALNHIGTFSWFYNGRTVDSLGKVDYKVVQATNDGKLKEFIESKGAVYIVDLFKVLEFEKIDKSDIIFSKDIHMTMGESPLGYLRGDRGAVGWYVAIVKLNNNTVKLLQN